MVDEKLYNILVDKISEISVSNDKAHKEINRCLVSVKVKLGKIETHCDNAANEHIDCLKYRSKIDNRVREVEKVTDKVEELPSKFDALVRKVFTLHGVMLVLLIIVGMWLKK